MWILGKQTDGGGQRGPAAFTLIELLVVLAIITILGGLILPSVNRTLNSGRAATCGSNARQLAVAMINFDNDFQYLPWYNEGYYKAQMDSAGNQTNSSFQGTNWVQKLDYFKYVPRADNSSPWLKGIWRCPGASFAEVTGKDVNGNPANCPSYAVCDNIFRQQNTLSGFNNVPQRPLKLSRITRPDRIWMVGDCSEPVSGSAPGSGYYFRVNYNFWRPSILGQWDFSSAYPAPQPALRHNNEAVWAGFDAHVGKIDWPGMLVETNDFTARSDASYF
jgi:prepilin-type N-terminal cleavage/methylation domain-containing protein